MKPYRFSALLLAIFGQLCSHFLCFLLTHMSLKLLDWSTVHSLSVHCELIAARYFSISQPAGRPAKNHSPAGRPAGRPRSTPAGRPAENHGPAGRPAKIHRPANDRVGRPAGRPAGQLATTTTTTTTTSTTSTWPAGRPLFGQPAGRLPAK